MANETEQTEQNETNLTVAQRVERARAKGKVQTLPEGTEAEAAKNAAKPEPKPERQVQPKAFHVQHSAMGNIPCLSTVMSFQDVVDYGSYAEDLYGDASDVTQHWQRGVSNPRVKSIRDYLLSEVHFFPALIAVPVKDVDANNAKSHEVTLTAGSLAWLDGQHRASGIEELLADYPDYGKETIPVVIALTDSIEARQQIFADINRTPRKVSKTLALVFDHTDRAADMAMKIGTRQAGSTENGHALSGLKGLIDFEKASPSKTSNNVMSLTGLYSLLNQKRGQKQVGLAVMKNEDGSYRFSQSELEAIVHAVIDGYPHIDKVRTGAWNYGQLHGTAQSGPVYMCYWNTGIQAIGVLLTEMADAKTPEGNLRFTSSGLADWTGDFMARVQEHDGWNATSPRWNGVVYGKKVGTQKDDIDRAVNVLRAFVS